MNNTKNLSGTLESSNRAEAINLHLAWVGTGPNTVTQTELGQHAFIFSEPSATCVNISARAEPEPNPR